MHADAIRSLVNLLPVGEELKALATDAAAMVFEQPNVFRQAGQRLLEEFRPLDDEDLGDRLHRAVQQSVAAPLIDAADQPSDSTE